MGTHPIFESDFDCLQNSMTENAQEKVEILLRAVGDAPVLKKNKFKLNRTQKIAFVSDFLRKATKCEADERIFLYIHQAFSPTMDSPTGTLFDNHASDNKLVLHYSKTPAWG